MFTIDANATFRRRRTRAAGAFDRI